MTIISSYSTAIDGSLIQKNPKPNNFKKLFPLNAIYSLLSVLFERAGFWGIRSVLSLYMINNLGYSEFSAEQTYQLLRSAIPFSYLIAAIVGYFLGSRSSSILGFTSSIIGCFFLLFPTESNFIIGVVLVLCGSGLGIINVSSSLAKNYLNKVEKASADFTLHFILINLGAFIGSVIIPFLADGLGFDLAFCVAALFLFFGLVFSVLSKNVREEQIDNSPPIKVDNRKAFLWFLAITLTWVLPDFVFITAKTNPDDLSRITTIVSSSYLGFFLDFAVSVLLGIILIFVLPKNRIKINHRVSFAFFILGI